MQDIEISKGVKITRRKTTDNFGSKYFWISCTVFELLEKNGRLPLVVCYENVNQYLIYKILTRPDRRVVIIITSM